MRIDESNVALGEVDVVAATNNEHTNSRKTDPGNPYLDVRVWAHGQRWEVLGGRAGT